MSETKNTSKIYSDTIKVELSMRAAAKTIAGQNIIQYWINTVKSQLPMGKRDFPYAAATGIKVEQNWNDVIDVIMQTVLNINLQNAENMNTYMSLWPLC